jgi:cytochrome c5
MIRVALLIVCLSAWGQTSKTVLDGVYTEAQAERGAAVFASTCARCHGENLQGRSDPALKGNGFIERWREDPLEVLFAHISTRMPPRGAGGPVAGLPQNTYLDLLAFILQQNEYPAGTNELSVESVKQVLLVGKDGPKPLSTNSLVGSVGCLTEAANGNWDLKNATEPYRVRVADEADSEDLKRAATRPAGTATVRLQNLTFFRSDFKPEPLAGKRVQAKGALIRRGNDIRINVLWLEPVGECMP